MAAPNQAPWLAPGRLLASARRAYGWSAAGVVARARTPVSSVPSKGDAGGEGERTAREKRTGDWRESAAGWHRVAQVAQGGTGLSRKSAFAGA